MSLYQVASADQSAWDYARGAGAGYFAVGGGGAGCGVGEEVGAMGGECGRRCLAFMTERVAVWGDV